MAEASMRNPAAPPAATGSRRFHTGSAAGGTKSGQGGGNRRGHDVARGGEARRVLQCNVFVKQHRVPPLIKGGGELVEQGLTKRPRQEDYATQTHQTQVEALLRQEWISEDMRRRLRERAYRPPPVPAAISRRGG